MTVVFEADGVRAEVDPMLGARLTSLQFGGHEVLATGHTPDGVHIGDGCFPMAPWAGRIGGGRIEHDGVTASLPLDGEGQRPPRTGPVGALGADR
jgi:aldose 1-epimerase